MDRSTAQQEVIARLAQRAVEPVELLTVLEEAVRALADTLAAEDVTVLEIVSQGEPPTLRLRAGIGWQEGALGATIEAMPGGHIAYTLASAEAVVVTDLAAERRFTPSPVLLDEGVVSSLATRIGSSTPFGVLGVHTTAPRTFDASEIGFVETVAALLAVTIARHRQAIEVNDGILQSLILARYAAAEGDRDRSVELIDDALLGARSMIGELLGDHALPGDLRRTTGA